MLTVHCQLTVYYRYIVKELVHLQPHPITPSVSLFINILTYKRFRTENSVTKGAKLPTGKNLGTLRESGPG
jgi:hypothetical protein